MKLLLSLLIPIALAAQVTYHGGPVLTSGARVYFMWYGPWVAADKVPFRNFTIGAQTGYLGALSGYYDSSATHIANVSQVVGETDMGTPYGQYPTAVQMIQAMEHAINQAGWLCDSTGVYVFMPGGGTYATGLGGASSHGSFPCGKDAEGGVATPTSVQVAGVYQPGNMTNYSHELVEAMTDPFGNWPGHEGWSQTGTGLEIADPGICGSASNYSLSTGTFLAANYLQLGRGCTTGTGGTAPQPPKPPKVCPPGTKPVGNSGKCK